MCGEYAPGVADDALDKREANGLHAAMRVFAAAALLLWGVGSGWAVDEWPLAEAIRRSGVEVRSSST